MPHYQASSDSLEGAKNSARDTADQTKRAAKDSKEDAKRWGQETKEETKRWGDDVNDSTKRWGEEVKDSTSNAWNQTKRWGRDRRADLEHGFDGFVDFGHPLINRVFDGIVKVGGVGALHAASQDSYKYLSTGEANDKALEKTFQRVGKDAVQWGLVAGVYSGVTYGISEARGVHDWKNAALGGALTGAALSLTETNPGADRVLRSAITGGAIATAAEILRNIT